MLATPRLILRPYTPADAPALAAATEESWEQLSQWMRWATDRAKFTNVENCAAYTAWCQERFQQKTDYTFGGFLKETGEFVLTTRLALTDQSPKVFEFAGYWCRTSMQGKGYMTEAIKAVMQWAFTELGAQRLIITHAAGNDKTRAVMDRVGFKEESIRKNAHRLPNGLFVDEHVLASANTAYAPT